MQTLSIAGNRNVHEAQWRIGVTESNNRNIYIACLSDGLMVSGRVRDDQQARFTKSSLEIKIGHYAALN